MVEHRTENAGVPSSSLGLGTGTAQSESRAGREVLLVSRCPPYPTHLGDRLIVWHLARELHQRGVVIDLLALHDRADDPQHVERYRDYFRHVQLFPEPRRRSQDLLRRLLSPRRRFASAAESSWSPPLWRAIKRQVRQRDYDLVHCFGGVSVYEFQPLFAHLPNLITPYESHSVYLRSAAAQGDVSARLQLPLVQRFERLMYRAYDRTVVISAVDAAALRRLAPGLPVEVIPNGIDLSQFRPRKSQREPNRLVFVGNFDYAPNQEAARLLVTRLLPEIQREIPTASLQLVGANPPDWLRDCASERVEVTRRVPDVAPYLAAAAAFVCPLRRGAGLKNKVLEALAMGAPVVATPLSVDGIAVTQGESALIAPLDQLAAETIRLLRDEALQARLSRQGRRLIEARYTWTRTADSYRRLYDEICAAR